MNICEFNVKLAKSLLLGISLSMQVCLLFGIVAVWLKP